jgi:hypothetical protein
MEVRGERGIVEEGVGERGVGMGYGERWGSDESNLGLPWGCQKKIGGKEAQTERRWAGRETSRKTGRQGKAV